MKTLVITLLKLIQQNKASEQIHKLYKIENIPVNIVCLIEQSPVTAVLLEGVPNKNGELNKIWLG